MPWPHMDVFHGYWVVHVIIESGATGNMIGHSTRKHLGCPIMSSAQSVQQADGSSQLHIIVTDITSAFYQIPLAKESMIRSTAAVATPFKGV